MLPCTHLLNLHPGCASARVDSVTSEFSPPFTMILSLLSPQYMNQPIWSCLRLLTQLIPWAFALALARAGKSKAARMAMIAMTTSNSISVNPANRQIRTLLAPLVPRADSADGGLCKAVVIGIP